MVFKKGNKIWEGRHHSERTRRLMSKRMFERENPVNREDVRKKISLRNTGKQSPFKGKHHTEEAKEKNRQTHLNKKLSEETKRKLSISHKGKGKGIPKSLETRKKLSESLKGKNLGEKNPSWLGGISFEPYDKEFNEVFKRSIRERDNQVCMVCGIHREKLNRILDIHHINYNKELSIPENCISICHSCHMKTNGNREHWIKFFQSLLHERYGYEYSMKKLNSEDIEVKGGENE